MFVRCSSLLAIISVCLMSTVVSVHASEARPVRLELAAGQGGASVFSHDVAPAQWLLPSSGLVAESRPSVDTARGYILHSLGWQSIGVSLSRAELGSELTLEFQSNTQKTYIIQSIFSVGPKSLDRAELADSPDTLLIYTSSGVADRERLVILAKERPSTEVSSL